MDGGWRHVSELGVRSGLVSWSMGTVVTAWVWRGVCDWGVRCWCMVSVGWGVLLDGVH